MNKIDIVNLTDEPAKSITLKNDFWQKEPNKKVIKDAIDLTNAALRQGGASTKTRGEVKGSGKKPWRQKGTGRARHGSFRSPIWRGGGVVFGPKPRDYSKKMNRKEKQLALKSALAIKFQNNEIAVLADFNLAIAKTKEMAAFLKQLNAPAKSLFIVEGLNDNIILAMRNIPKLNLLAVTEINVYDIINSDKIYLTEASLQKIEEVLQ